MTSLNEQTSSLIITEANSQLNFNNTQQKSIIQRAISEMGDGHSPSSLIVAQAAEQIEINSSQEESKRDSQIFQLSRDQLENTLSFFIEEEHRESIVTNPVQNDQKIEKSDKKQEVVSSQINPRKRREIFDKFKRPRTQKLIQKQQPKVSDNILNIFDSIFKVSCMGDLSKPPQNRHQSRFFASQSHISRQKTPSAQKRQRAGIFSKKTTSLDKPILPSDILSPMQIQRDAKLSNLLAQNSQVINMSSIQNRVSGIYQNMNLDQSKDTIQINQILQSQIFKEQQSQHNNRLKNHNFSKKQAQSPQRVVEKLTVASKQIQRTNSTNSTTKIQETPMSEYSSTIVKANISSISSTSTIVLNNYRQSQVGGFQPQNSMAHVNINFAQSSIIANFSKKPQNTTNLVQSQIVYQSPLQLTYQPTVFPDLFCVQQRIPIFLRQIRKQISAYPNLYITLQNPNTLSQLRTQLQTLFDLSTKSIDTLHNFCQKVQQIKSKTTMYMNQLINNLTLVQFTQLGWQHVVRVEQYEMIKPQEGFQKRNWDYQRANQALINYRNIVDYYRNKKFTVDVGTDQGKKKYFEIRQKFWDICGNMKLISQDVYNQMLRCMFPNHFYVFLNFLKEKDIVLDHQRVRKVRFLMNLYRQLKHSRDILIFSEVGQEIRLKLQGEMNYLSPL